MVSYRSLHSANVLTEVVHVGGLLQDGSSSLLTESEVLSRARLLDIEDNIVDCFNALFASILVAKRLSRCPPNDVLSSGGCDADISQGGDVRWVQFPSGLHNLSLKTLQQEEIHIQ